MKLQNIFLNLSCIVSCVTLCCAAVEKTEKEVSTSPRFEINSNDASLTFNGRIKDELFLYNRVNTLRSDNYDANDFIRHKLNIDIALQHGKKLYRAPATQGFVRLTNYLYWQHNDKYMPFITDQSDALRANFNLAQHTTHVRNLMPLIFAEQAWFKLNFERFTDLLYDRPTSLKVGFFPYTLGRGIALGYHDGVAVESLGWSGEGDFTRYPYMPPAILFNIQLAKNLTADFYFSKWREVDATQDQTTEPVRHNRLSDENPERGTGKDRNVWSLKADYTINPSRLETWHLQPYWLYVDAPEQSIEVAADASAKLHTLGMMVNVINDNVTVNVECAGQFGHQDVHAIDRNVIEDGNFTHVFLGSNDSRVRAPAGNTIKKNTSINYAKTENQLAHIVNIAQNRTLSQQGQALVKASGNLLKVNPFSGSSDSGSNDIQTYNANIFNNKRFRSGYKLDYQGVMALVDVGYDLLHHPIRLGAAAGYISGDEYPYNHEVDGTYHGFIPLRSRYKGEAVKSILIFDRLIIPRPMNISYKELYAFNNLKNLSDLQYLGLGLTWYPLEKRKTLSLTNDFMFFWKAAQIKKWDKNGTSSDPLANQSDQLPFDQQQLHFTGWESSENAHRFLGAELDIKVLYQFLDHCKFLTKVSLFFPGQLYKDLDGQPNVATRRIDALGNIHYDSLGNQPAFGFICGLDYSF
ncbi:MAG: hypothetical protein WCT20_03210 [Candidatus Babeliales bacterium]